MKHQEKTSQVPSELGRKEDPKVSGGSARELQSSQENKCLKNPWLLSWQWVLNALYIGDKLRQDQVSWYLYTLTITVFTFFCKLIDKSSIVVSLGSHEMKHVCKKKQIIYVQPFSCIQLLIITTGNIQKYAIKREAFIFLIAFNQLNDL